MSLSAVPLSDDSVIVFDLDDTLYAERDFVRSGFRAISQQFGAEIQANVFRQLLSSFELGVADPLGVMLNNTGSSLNKASLLNIYREHQPDIQLSVAVSSLLNELSHTGHKLGILTDGRSVTQRNKIKALDLGRWISEIVISEEFGFSKPDPRNYRYFEKIFGGNRFTYIADNLAKDFVTPNQLGWVTIALLDRGGNIHPQRLDEVTPDYCPQFFIHELA